MTKNSSNSSRARGNTKLSPKSDSVKQEAPKKRYCMTLNNYTEKEYSQLKDFFSSNSSNKWIIGREIGSIEKTEHLQIYVNFKEKIRFSAIKKINERLHIEECKGTEEQNIAYCSKDGKYEAFGLIVKRKPKILSDDELYEWQKEIVDLVKTMPDDRTINWYWDSEGNKGKTSLAKKLAVEYGAVPVEGKKNDILYCAAEHESDVYIFDFERSMEEFISYSGIEKIKNGFYMCSKYESKPIIRACPHVIIFANFEPDRSKLSKDRWNIKRINNIRKVAHSSSKEEEEDKNEKEEKEEEGLLPSSSITTNPWDDMDW